MTTNDRKQKATLSRGLFFSALIDNLCEEKNRIAENELCFVRSADLNANKEERIIIYAMPVRTNEIRK